MPTNPATPLHFLVTAGPTREKIDDVRDWGNIFTGKTGLDLALAFTSLGSVTLLTSNDSHARDFDGYSGTAGMIGVETFRSHADLHALLQERLTSGDPIHAAAMTSAVADYLPTATYRVVSKKVVAGGGNRELWEVENVSAPKVKSTHDEIAVLGKRSLKLIDQFRTTWNYRGLLIKFKLEVAITDEQLLAVAAASRTASNADLMVANTLAMARPTDGSGGAAYLIDDQKTERVPRAALAQQIVAWTQSRVAR